MLLIVSDLHLGRGDALDDFLLWGPDLPGPSPEARPAAIRALDAEFHRFLRAHRRLAAAAGISRPALLLLGDTFDFWQARRPRETPSDALLAILESHPRWLAAVREWTGEGGDLHLVLGNHDHEAAEPRAWALLREVIPQLNARRGGAPLTFFSDESIGLYAEHGHRWDPYNRLRSAPGARPRCLGHAVVRALVNPAEGRIPWIDKGRGLADIIRVAATHLGPDALLAASPLVDWRSVAARQLAALDSGLRRALSPTPRSTTGPLPSQLKYFVTGHTHRALRAEAGHGVERINTGTWRPTLQFDDTGATAIQQPLHYALLLPNAGGTRDASLRQWNTTDLRHPATFAQRPTRNSRHQRAPFPLPGGGAPSTLTD